MEKEYAVDTEEGKKTLAELFDGRSQLGWKFPWVSSFGSDFNFDFDFAFTPEQMATGELAKMVAEADDWLKDWAENVGTDLASGMAEAPGWNAFALEDGVVYHTYSRTAPDRFLLAPYYYQLLDQIPNGRDGRLPATPPRRVLGITKSTVSDTCRGVVTPHRKRDWGQWVTLSSQCLTP